MHPNKSRATPVAAIVNVNLLEIMSMTLTECTVTEAEAAAIALAIQHGDATNRELHIITDSLVGCRLLLEGRIHKRLHKLTNCSTSSDPSLNQQITWIPAHSGLEGNDVVESIARGSANQSGYTHTHTTPN